MSDALKGGLGCLAAIVVVIGIIVFGYAVAAADLGLWQPWAVNQQTKIVRHSIGYVDAQNAHARDDINQWYTAKAAGDTAHMNALQSDICATVGQLHGDQEIAPDVAQFIAAHPCVG